MNKIAIKNFAIWARNKLIADISYKAGLLGITEKEIKSPLPQSTQTVQFFDIGTKDPSSITGSAIEQRKKLVEEIQRKAKDSDHATAYKNVIEEVAYTWFNRLIAIRFMEVNDYLPTRIRVLSSEGSGKAEPDLVTHALEANLDYSAYEKDRIIQLKHENKLDELFRMLFIKQCNALNANLPELFEKTNDYTELLLNVSFTDNEGVIYHLVNDIPEDDFNVSKEGQVEIIGWLYQYYNTEPKDEAFDLLKKNIKITKERIPAATQLFTPDWIVRYMVENSLGRLWLDGHPNDELKANWKYFLDEAEQEDDVKKQLNIIRKECKEIELKDIKVIDPAMGSGHILIYAFDVLMQIYESHGYSQREAAISIVENNLYGLDIDNRAYQLAYFAVLMKARQYNRRILAGDIICHVYAIQESNNINRNQLDFFGSDITEIEKNTALLQIQSLLDIFIDAKEYGSILNVADYNWDLLRNFINGIVVNGQMSFDSIGVEYTRVQLNQLVRIGEVLAQKYDVVITNPPYMGINNGNSKLNNYVKSNFPDSKADLFAVFIELCRKMVKPNRYTAMITQHAWMFLSSFEKIRGKLLNEDLINMAHLGTRAFEEIGGEVVQTTTWVSRNSKVNNYKAKYVRLTSYNTQKQKEENYLTRRDIYICDNNSFSKIPNQVIAYWIGENYKKIFEFDKLSDFGNSCIGMRTGDNERFLRMWFEVDHNKLGLNFTSADAAQLSCKKWFPYCKGGSFRKWYGNNDYVVNWENDGFEIKENTRRVYPQLGDNLGWKISNEQYYFKRGITWSGVGASVFGVRCYPEGMIFDSGANSYFVNDDQNYFYFAGLLNTKLIDETIKVINPTINTGSGVIAVLPAKLSEINRQRVSEIVQENVLISKNDWDCFETSWDFSKHPLIISISSIEDAFDLWKRSTEKQYEQLKSNEEELNRIFLSIYGLKDEIEPAIDDCYITVRKSNLTRDIKSLISYAIGCIFGRYSIDNESLVYAGGEWDGSKYSGLLPDKDNIIPITDEEYFPDDLINRFVDFVRAIYGHENLEKNLDFVAQALDGKGKSSREIIRNYFLKDFYKDHCQVYQKRPIYWLFDSGKQNGFKALVYMHRYDENTIGNLRIDYLHRMQRIYENEIARMQDTIENSGGSREVNSATKQKEKLIKQLQETKEYDEKIAHLALTRTSIDLDDGIKVNYEKVQTDRDGKMLDVLAKI